VRRALALVSLLVLTAAAPFENAKLDGEAFSRPMPGLDVAQSKSFHAGSGLFRQAWVIGPSLDHPDVVGLGPLYNRLSCIACHVKNGRGAAPGDEGGVARAMVLRLSKPGVDRGAFGAPLPHPVYGAQLNPEGAPGVPGEGRAVIRYEFFESKLVDGTAVAMRRPRVALEDLAYGPLEPETPTSLRNAPPVYGLGLLEAVPEAEILALAAKNGGRPNHVYDIESGAKKLGRFGLKANQPNLRQQIANAFAEDIGISSSLFPGENCTPAEVACLSAAKGAPQAELTEAQLAEALEYIRALAPPARRGADDARVKRGEALFGAIGCAACHRETLMLGAFAPLPEFAGAQIHPYTDLLLHDMGEELADGRADFLAGPRDWRTPPLWGLGLAGKFGDAANFLHDGRARAVAEAILWHGGEAQAAAEAFRNLAGPERDALLAFLNSL
jgi:CxxC motif-containing protein (DUF1111 family)